MENLIGQRFGKLVVKENVRSDKVRCLCDCGKMTEVRKYRLINGHTKSCGCLRHKKNRYDLSGDYGICYFNDGDFFIFDLDDYDKIKDYAWNKTYKGYAKSPQREIVHRLIMDCPEGMVVDHINHDKSDNRKSNLRICTAKENSRNRRIAKNNTSGANGVSYRKDKNKWRVRITYNRKVIHIGDYDTIEEAKKARREAELKYYGDFAIKEV